MYLYLTNKQQISSNFSVLHVNAGSVAKKLDNLVLLLNRLNHLFTVIAVSETWANDFNQSYIVIPGYNCVMKPRTTSTSGGVTLFIRNHLPLIEIPDLNVHANINFECIFIKLSNKELGNRLF